MNSSLDESSDEDGGLLDEFDVDEDDPPAEAGAAGSNPLASVSQVDLSWTYLDLDGADIQDFQLFGSTMLHPRLKVTAELHYWSTDLTGSRENDWESFRLKPIFFAHDAILDETWKMRIAVGAEWIYDFNHRRKGIGEGSDQIAPLVGVALNNSDWGVTLIPMVQHFVDYHGDTDINTTAFRLIGLKPLPQGQWLKLDGRILRDWENNTLPANAELEYGKMFSPSFGAFGAGSTGIGGDRIFELASKIGVRLVF